MCKADSVNKKRQSVSNASFPVVSFIDIMLRVCNSNTEYSRFYQLVS